MLTKDDLEQIDKLIEKRTVPIEKRFSPLEKSMSSFERLMVKFDKRMEGIEKTLKKQGKKQDFVISYFDRNVTRVAKKVDRIEKHIGLPTSE